MARLGWALTERHTSLLPFPKMSSPGEPPVPKTNDFFLKILARNFPLCHQCHKRVVWLSDVTAD